jgi:hypothetical protein
MDAGLGFRKKRHGRQLGRNGAILELWEFIAVGDGEELART